MDSDTRSDDLPLGGPDEALALIREQQRTVAQRQLGGIPWVLVAWGVSWFIGFLALWSGYEGGNPWLRIPLGVAATIYGLALLAASGVTVISVTRISRGVRGPSNFSGAVYGITWFAGFAATYLIGIALARAGADQALVSLYLPSAFGVLIGLMYLMGAALWRSTEQLVLGALIVLTSVIAAFFGAPTNNLVMALLGGGSLVVAGIVMRLSLRRRSS
ncbi:hypothetical protein OVN18_07885 [Microcella daejeonensis]|uniref:Uncharacterized protein n=1 Tax=Microcella daejeonensis TaxID=2994971 RepID=A0A9E8S817_9MICO|nr:hypothetical protein [Microcella daejeonensis]WAB80494.1 hypothetical protein OVN18_07885 [Microcella daejeonensis]